MLFFVVHFAESCVQYKFLYHHFSVCCVPKHLLIVVSFSFSFSRFVCSKVEEAIQLLIDANRIPEAAFMARTYMPSQISR